MNRKIILTVIISLLLLPAYGFGLTIKSVDFMTVESKSRLQIGLDGKATFDVKRDGDNLTLLIDNARVPGNLARPFITREFETAVTQILPRQQGNKAVFDITMKQIVPYFVSQDNHLLIMDFDIPEWARKDKPSTQDKIVVVQSAATPDQSGQPLQEKGPAVPSVRNIPAVLKGSNIVERSYVEPTYTGERISLDFQNADIHNVLRIIADVSGLNIVTSDQVKGNITIRLKDIPWDQALDVVLESKDLDKMAVGNVVRIDAADKIKKAQERKLESLKTEEQLEPLVTSVIPVNFAKASDIAGTIKGKEVGLVSDRGSITAEDRTNVLIVKDIKKNVDDIESMIKRLDKSTPQVLIAARIVQADNDFTRGLGVQWGGSFRNQSDRSHFGLSGVNTGPARGLFNTTVVPGTRPTWSTATVPQPSLAVNFPTNQAAGFGITVGRLAGSAFDLDLRLDIGETIGTAEVIARPKIVTMDNKKAIIRQGEKYPYVVRDDDGQLSTELKDIELVLEVTPRIAFDGSVNMEISVKRNAIGSIVNSLGDPSIASREAQTEVLVRNGETSVIGGIIEEEERTNVQRVPFLGKLPVVGFLFSGKTQDKSKKELLIFITPQILEPVAMK
ncbi:MAG: Type IV pilus biogenesis and competence protein PilQ precursor [Deltaproteobacteria bacterium ADurb.BinA179]|jgi:type IV pilus assembly protein PilQ|nr:type IV pilus secretin PilQ [Deltaproteobacteria bacterium]MDI9543195.1 type IV pilus secretin PilQ [Pseudomonadota bacterium]NLW67806.1 type IV pilus secretin PilQ [Bacteriovoracaceae bacterium]OPZ27880.1 MAG: Type IV pilus biogenesis and competence protein PilQ precursor [Deltaproteobacteria bacterium ADurb.BinA179]HRR22236.1 type IV pilus secretin PilQ [Desulfomonilia bacterium]